MRGTRRTICLLSFVLGLAAWAGAASIPNEQCLKCHGDPSIADSRPESLAARVSVPAGQSRLLRPQEDIPALYTPERQFRQSAHAGLSCTDCHLGIDRLPHAQRLAEISCSDCHLDVEGAIEAGPHSPLLENGLARPNCGDCHGPTHEIRSLTAERSYQAVTSSVLACERCHSKGDDSSRDHVASYMENVHGVALFKKGLVTSASCIDCHGYHKMLPPANPDSPLNAQNVPATCGECHEGIAQIYKTSVHGQQLLGGDDEAATCTNCHHSHGIQEVGEPFLLAVVEECSHCHLELGESYLRSYHGKATQLGYGQSAVCSSCHGAHDILPASNPDSRVAQANLVDTCRTCHKDANENFTKYIAHIDYTDRHGNTAVYFTFIGMTTLLLSVLAVFIPHTILWFQRTLIGRLKNPAGPHAKPAKVRMVRRFSTIHRVTHGLIIISFMGLVATGFPLKYSYTNWAHEMTALFGGLKAMGILHRVFAIITFGYAGVHAAFLGWFFLFKCPKPRWRYLLGPDSMMFSWRDVKDFVAMVRWFFWLGPRPKFDRWAYFEKFDYFGEIWGVFLIGGSGLMLWFPTLFTRWLPGWVLNCAMVIHSIEALLAASVIFLVHFFNTHLRPEKFPIDMTMYTGQMSEEEMIEERGAEYERLIREGKLEERIVEPMSLKWRIVGVVLGITAFLTGIILIALAARTELHQFFG